MSRMVGNIISIFPSMTIDFVLNKLSFQQFFLWHDRAVEIKTGTLIKRDRSTVEEIKEQFTYDETLKRWK